MGAWAGIARSTVGAAAILGLAASCSHEEAPPREARQPTPTFESKVEMGTIGTAAVPAPSPLDGSSADALGRDMGPGSVEQPDWAATAPEKPPPVDERDLCDSIARDASLTMESIQGGASILITPRLASNMETLRSDASGLAQAIAAAAPRSGSPAAHACSLFDLAGAGAHVAFVDGDRKLELHITTNDPTAIRGLRASVRELVKEAPGRRAR